MNKEFLKELIECVSVSGKEEAIQRKIRNHMADCCDESRVDASGNLYTIINPEAKQRVLLSAHVDEIGFYVNRIYPDGTVGVIRAGGVRAPLYLGTHVQIQGRELVHGVVMSHRELENRGNVKPEDLRIDVGMDSREMTEKLISIGDALCSATTIQDLRNERFAARAVDDRGGAFIILEAIRKARVMGSRTGMFAVTTTGEETTRRGAFHASVNVRPTCAVVVDVTYATDCQGALGGESGDVYLGKGAVLCHSSIVNKQLQKRMEQTAKKYDIPVQWEVMPGFTYTDGDTIHLSNEGVPVVLVSLPLRYMHSSIEMADYRDVQSCIDLIAHFLYDLEEDFSFIPEIE